MNRSNPEISDMLSISMDDLLADIAAGGAAEQNEYPTGRAQQRALQQDGLDLAEAYALYRPTSTKANGGDDQKRQRDGDWFVVLPDLTETGPFISEDAANARIEAACSTDDLAHS